MNTRTQLTADDFFALPDDGNATKCGLAEVFFAPSGFGVQHSWIVDPG